MRAKEILSRINGVSLPIVGGLSWAPSRLDRDVAREVITFLEDRRALYNPFEVEVADHVVMSIVDIRRFLTDVISQGEIVDELEHSLRFLRAACREFLDSIGIQGEEIWVPPVNRLRNASGMDDFQFNQALGKLRGLFGLQVGAIAAKFDLDVEDGLATILPPPPDEE